MEVECSFVLLNSLGTGKSGYYRLNHWTQCRVASMQSRAATINSLPRRYTKHTGRKYEFPALSNTKDMYGKYGIHLSGT